MHGCPFPPFRRSPLQLRPALNCHGVLPPDASFLSPPTWERLHFSKNCKINQPSLSKLSKKLVIGKWVVVQQSPSDRRVVLTIATDRAKEKVMRLRTSHTYSVNPSGTRATIDSSITLARQTIGFFRNRSRLASQLREGSLGSASGRPML